MYHCRARLRAKVGFPRLIFQQMHRRMSRRQRRPRQPPDALQVFVYSFQERTAIQKRSLQAQGWLAHRAPPPPLHFATQDKSKAAPDAMWEPQKTEMVASLSNQNSRNVTSIGTCVGTGLPLGPMAGLHFQVRTASIAFSSRPMPGPFTTERLVTRPSRVMMPCRTTMP